MKLIKSKKGIALLGVLVVAAVAAFGAYAYFTSTGNGTGSAQVGSATNWTVGESGSPSGGDMFPDAAIGGAHVQTHHYTVTNPGSGSQSLSQVVISIANSDGSPWSSQADPLKPACDASDFSIDGLTVGTAKTDTALAGTFVSGQVKSTGVLTVELIDNNANQDNCQGLTGATAVPLYFAAS